MQQFQAIQEEFETKNIMTLGKTGSGKSYFLNMILKEEKPKNGVFSVYDRLESGTKECHIEEKRIINYNQQNSIQLNLIDTPGLFDTEDNPNVQYNNENKPKSIRNIEIISNAVQNQPFQSEFHKVIIVMSPDQRFDPQLKEILSIITIMIPQSIICVALTKSQNLYNVMDEPSEKLEILKNKLDQWKSTFKGFGIQDVYCFAFQPIQYYSYQLDPLNKFYGDQWISFYNSLKISEKKEINAWEMLKKEERQQIGNFFHYRIGPTEEQIAQIHKQELEKKDQDCQNQIERNQRNCQPQIIEIHHHHYHKRRHRCISLDVFVYDNNDNKLGYDELFYEKYYLKGIDQKNICLGLTHLSKKTQCQFYQFIFQYNQQNKFVELSPDHLIFCSNKDKFIRAEDITINDTLLYCQGLNQERINVKIQTINFITKIGYYSPLTNTGIFFGNGILLSCYVSPKEFPISQRNAQFLMKPLIIYRQLTMKFVKNDDGQKRHSEYNREQGYLAPYVKILFQIFVGNK